MKISVAFLDQELFGIKRRANILINYAKASPQANDFDSEGTAIAIARRIIEPLAALRFLASDKPLPASAHVDPFEALPTYENFTVQLHEVHTLLKTLDEHVEWFSLHEYKQIELLEEIDGTFTFSDWAFAIENALSELEFFL
jgi:hypothetical protein